MKKILSLCLALLMLVSAVPTAMAADTDYTNGTQIVLQGSNQQASYTVTVPAQLSPGESGTVTASGSWGSNQKLNVSCPNSVKLTYGDQEMDVGVTFYGIHQVGSDTQNIKVNVFIEVEEASVLFGTWTGHLTYDVEMVTEEAEANLITFTIGSTEYQAEAGMTWKDWVNSKYNYEFDLAGDVCKYGLDSGGVICLLNGEYLGRVSYDMNTSDTVSENDEIRDGYKYYN